MGRAEPLICTPPDGFEDRRIPPGLRWGRLVLILIFIPIPIPILILIPILIPIPILILTFAFFPYWVPGVLMIAPQ